MNEQSKKPVGRPTSFNVARAAAIVQAVKLIGFGNVAAEMNGIHRGTLANWLKRGDSGEEPFAEFADEYHKARAEWQRDQIKKLDADPRWLLERSDPQFRQQQDVHHDGGVDVNFGALSTAELERRMRNALEGKEEDNGESDTDV